MRNPLIFSSLLLLMIFRISAFQSTEKRAFTEDGKVVLLKDDGTWKEDKNFGETHTTKKTERKTKYSTNSNEIVTALSTKDIADFLAVHNQERKRLGIPSLEWSQECADYANDWANHLKNTGCSMSHRPNNKYGENIFAGSGKEYTLKDAAEAWMTEKSQFKGGSNWQNSGHYSQMIWRKTTKVGAARVRCDNGSIMIIANYDPQGNFIGEKAY